MKMTLEQLINATGISSMVANKWLQPLNEAMQKYSINTPLRAAHFIAQVGHETGSFRRTVENLDYSETALLSVFPNRITPEQANKYGRNNEHASNPQMIANIVYGGRMGNGAAGTGDGFRYRGRGAIMITGKDNYKKFGYLDNPDALAEPKGAADSAGQFWDCNELNKLADKDNILSLTKKINGGTNGLKDREARLIKAKGAFNYGND